MGFIMWIVFLLAFAVVLVVLYLPGFLISIFIFEDKLKAFAVSPVLSLGICSIVGVVLGRLAISASGAMFLLLVLLASLLVGAFAYLLKGKRESELDGFSKERKTSNFPAALLCVIFSLAVLAFYFVKGLNGPDSVMQQSDNAWHLAVIAEMIASGDYSVLSVSVRDGIEGGFYPAAWHIVCALASSIAGASVAISENAVNYALSGVVLPLASLGMILSFFPEKGRIGHSVPFCAIASTAFPIGLYLFGPLYPNLAGMCCLPAFITLFVLLVSCSGSVKALISWVFIFLLSCVGLASLHPSCLFLAGIMLVPYCCRLLYERSKQAFSKRWVACLPPAFFALACVAAWSVVYFLPSFSATVGYYWPAISTPEQAALDIASLSLRNGIPQPVLSFLVFLGIIGCLAEGRNRWVIVPFAFTSLQYFVCASSDGFLDSFLTGFWYTDQWRIAANVAFTSIPLSCLGLYYLGCTLASMVRFFMKGKNSLDLSRAKRVLCVSGSIFLSFLIYCPSYSSQVESMDSAFGYAGKKIEEQNSGYSVTYSSYTNEERAFVGKVKEIAGDSLVFNCLPDGSCFAYSEDDLNVYYRAYSDDGPGSEGDSKALRAGLNAYLSDGSVKEIIDRLGIKYVMILDVGQGYDDQGDMQWSINSTYKKSEWSGVMSIDEKTPGFKLAASEGVMRLYEIAA